MADKNIQKVLGTDAQHVELVQFSVGENLFAIPVMQVKEIIRVFENIVPVPDAHPAIEGAINIRGEIIPVVNLAKHLAIEPDTDIKDGRIIVSQCAGSLVGFWVSTVMRIHLVATETIDQASSIVQSQGQYVVGATRIEGVIVLILDLQKIVTDIDPEHK